MVSNMMPFRLHQTHKGRVQAEARVSELSRENGTLRLELSFYKVCFENAGSLYRRVQEVSKQLLLMQQFDSQYDAQSRQDMYGHLGHEIQEAVDAWKHAAADAEREWFSFLDVDMGPDQAGETMI